MKFERMKKENTKLLVSLEHQMVINLQSMSVKKVANMVAKTESI